MALKFGIWNLEFDFCLGFCFKFGKSKTFPGSAFSLTLGGLWGEIGNHFLSFVSVVSLLTAFDSQLSQPSDEIMASLVGPSHLLSIKKILRNCLQVFN